MKFLSYEAQTERAIQMADDARATARVTFELIERMGLVVVFWVAALKLKSILFGLLGFVAMAVLGSWVGFGVYAAYRRSTDRYALAGEVMFRKPLVAVVGFIVLCGGGFIAMFAVEYLIVRLVLAELK